MNCTLLLHSTTGNTRLLARLARTTLQELGHACTIHDIVKQPEPPDLEQTELLIVAAPTMYFRVTYAMERFVAELRPVSGRRPALLLGTCSGEPGAHFELLAQDLEPKGWVTLGAHWEVMPTNWPPHRRFARPFALAEPIAEQIGRLIPAARPLLSLTWPDVGVPVEPRQRLERFLERMLDRAGALSEAPEPRTLHRGLPGMAEVGRRMRVEMMRKATDPTIDAARCGRCGTCVAVCPVGCITRSDEEAVPSVGHSCTGCWACFNHCPDGAIAGWFTPPGKCQYRAPAPEVRRLFR
jgi:NAD-dependent dihydropyrimidine dehydrogenase PreA subunit/flavodoxin